MGKGPCRSYGAVCMTLQVKMLERWLYSSHTLIINFLSHAVNDQCLKAETQQLELTIRDREILTFDFPDIFKNLLL